MEDVHDYTRDTGSEHENKKDLKEYISLINDLDSNSITLRFKSEDKAKGV